MGDSLIPLDKDVWRSIVFFFCAYCFALKSNDAEFMQ